MNRLSVCVEIFRTTLSHIYLSPGKVLSKSEMVMSGRSQLDMEWPINDYDDEDDDDRSSDDNYGKTVDDNYNSNLFKKPKKIMKQKPNPKNKRKGINK